MKILCTSDIHIGWWQNNCKMLETGVPDRLHLFQYLAEDILEIARNNNVNAIVVAGDISNTSSVRPEVAYYIQTFLEILSSDANIALILTLGQHDLSVKNDSFEDLHSIITPLVPKKSNVYYCLDETYLNIADTTFHVVPFKLSVFKDYKKADVFVSHGFVNGCTDVNGYQFTNGFSKYDLTDFYELSVIGDIHHHQVHTVNDRYVIQPGSPHCNKYGDDHQCGVYIYEVGSNEYPLFIDNYQFAHSDSYYTFITIDEDDDFDFIRPNTYPRIRNKKKVSVNKIDTEYQLDMKSIFNTIHNDRLDLQNIFQQLYLDVDTKLSVMPQNVILNSIEIENFLSIDYFKYDFSNRDELLIIGTNGSGKSSFLEAIFFTITGDTTKKIELDNLIREGTDGFKLTLSFYIDNEIYYIVRDRYKKSSSLNFYKKNIESGFKLTQTSMLETQKLILTTLGVSKEELFSFVYFSAKGYRGFCSLSSKDKYNTIAKLANLDKLDSIREINNKKLLSLNQDLKSNNFLLSQLESDNSVLKNKIDLITTELNTLDCTDYELELNLVTNEIETLKESLVTFQKNELINENTKFKIQSNESVLLKLKQSLSHLLERKASLESSTCPECHQSYLNDDLFTKLEQTYVEFNNINLDIEKHTTELHNLKKSLISIPNLTEIKTKLTKLENDRLEYTKLLKLNQDVSFKRGQLESLIQELNSKTEKLKALRETISNIDNSILLHKEIDNSISRNGPLVKSLLENVITLLNESLNKLFESSLFRVRFFLSKEIELLVKIDNKVERSFENLSSGESKVVEVALVIAFINTYCRIYNLPAGLLNFAFFDELFTFLDPVNLQLCKSILDQCLANRVVISHEIELQSLFARKLFVTKVDGVSKYKLI